MGDYFLVIIDSGLPKESKFQLPVAKQWFYVAPTSLSQPSCLPTAHCGIFSNLPQ